MRGDFDLSQEGDIDRSEDEVVSPRSVPGSMSDRTPAPVHRRRAERSLGPWLWAGSILTMLFLAGLAFAATAALLLVWWL